jgi:hypothetical protein
MADATKREMPVAFLAGAVIVALLVAGAVYWSAHSGSAATAAPQALPWGSAEQAYAAQIKFSAPRMSRATNFLNQEQTYVFGTVENDGTQSIGQIEVTLEYHDVFNQVVLRDTQRLFQPPFASLGPGQTYDFQLTYDHMPEQWSQTYPTIRVSGLDLK